MIKIWIPGSLPDYMNSMFLFSFRGKLITHNGIITGNLFEFSSKTIHSN